MKMIFAMLICLGILLPAANAQQPGSPQYNSVYLPAHGVGDTRPREPRDSDRWGAMAVSLENSLTGFSLDGRTREQAESAAIRTCLDRGGIRCEADFAFLNRCAVVATGNGQTISVDDRSLSSARKSALRRCGKGCKVLYEGCADAAGG